MTATNQGDGNTEPPSISAAAASLFRPLGFWASILWLAIAVVVSVLAVVLLLVLAGLTTNIDVLKDEIVVEITAPIVALVFVAVLVSAVRRIEWSASDYFAMVLPTRQALVIAFIGTCIIALIEELLTLYFIPDWGDFGIGLTDFRAVRAAGTALVALYCFNLVIVTPIIEEIAFRGFLYRGWSSPPLGPRAAIVLTAVVFGAAHVQYSWLGMVDVGVSALFLGWLRWRSDSIIPSMLSHATMNVAALISLALAA
jgi:membrane protease YdiL (CAAX protease family)